MRNKISLTPSIMAVFVAVFALGVFVFIGAHSASAAAGDVKVTVTREGDSGALSGATVEVMCTGGAYTQLTGSPTTNGSGIVQAAPQAASDCGNGENLDIRVALDGYVTKTSTGLTYVAAADPNDYSVTNVLFGFKVTGVADELSGALSTVTVATGTAFGVACVEGGGAWYCPVPLAHTAIAISVIKDGYVTSTATSFDADRTAATDAQQTKAITGIQFSHKFVVKNELNAALTPTSATAGGASVACTVSTNNLYCPILLADDNTVANGAVIVKDGYVTTTASDVPLASNRTAGTDAQAVTTMTGTNGLDFAHKFVVVDELGTSLTVTSATAGSASVACTISGGAAYCPVLLAQDNTAANGLVAAKDGYVTSTASDIPLASNRTAGTDAQGVTTMTTTNGLDFAIKVTVVAASNNAAITGATVVVGDSLAVTCAESGSTGVYYCIAPLADTATAVRSTANNYNVKNDTYTDRSAATDAQVAVSLQMTALTGSGSGGGSSSGGGSRGGATGFAPTTPVNTNTNTNTTNNQPAPAPAPAPAPVLKLETQLAAKADESRALTNFKLLYKRSANLKNATDRDAVNIMANGVAKNIKRDLKAEQKAIVKFRTTFGFLPKLARHWNIIRSIAYSGVTK